MLIATLMTRVFFMVLPFAAERDTTYVKITMVVLFLLLFSVLVTPFIPLLNARVQAIAAGMSGPA